MRDGVFKNLKRCIAFNTFGGEMAAIGARAGPSLK
jgi:hypothetical protein